MTVLTAEPTRRLSKAEWLSEGVAMLVEEGVEAVQITRLAKRLDVTRGSFYWHFEDRGALLDAMIAEWRARNTGVMVQAVADAASLTAGIFALFLVWVDHRRFDPDLDQAMRDWGRRSADVERVLAEEDAARVDAIAAFYRRMGYADPEAFIRARVLYFTQVSYYALGVREPMEERLGYLGAYFEAFTGRTLDEAEAAEFRERLVASETGT